MGKKILLVDSDQQFCKLVVPVLEGRGHKVFEADSGKQGEALLGKETLDLVIVCGPLPDGDALEWINSLRTKGNNVQIAFVAASSQEVARNKYMLEHDLGVSLLIHKPVIPFVFGAQVESQFTTEGAEAQAKKLKDFETMFLALVTKYARVLPAKLSDLSGAIEKSRANPEDLQLIKEVRSQAHKIKGTGGSLGFRQVGEAMAFIENAAATMPDKTTEEQLFVWAEVERKLLDAREAGEREANEVAAMVEHKAPSEPEHEPAMARIMVVDSDNGFLDIVENLGRQRLVEIVRGYLCSGSIGPRLPPAPRCCIVKRRSR